MRVRSKQNPVREKGKGKRKRKKRHT